MLVILVYLLAKAATALAGLPDMWAIALANGALVIVVASALSAMGWWHRIGFRRIQRRRQLLYFVPGLLPVVINLGAGVQFAGVAFVAGMFVLAMAVAFVEESVCRGLMLRALELKGLWRAALLTSVLFGLTHLLNILAGKSLVDASAQVFYTMALGFAFAALALTTRVIWPLVALHGSIDFASFLQKPSEVTTHASWVIVVGVAVIYGSYGLLLMFRTRASQEQGPPSRTRPRAVAPVA